MATTNKWLDLRTRFVRLTREEQAHVQTYNRAAGNNDELYIYAYFSMWRAQWKIGGGTGNVEGEEIRERVRALLMDAGRTLGCSTGTEPESFWIGCLYLYLRDYGTNISEQRLIVPDEEGGAILRVCQASIPFCSRLEQGVFALLQTIPSLNDLIKGQTAPEPSVIQQLKRSTIEETEPRLYKTSWGQKIDELRKDCGWSFEKLANKTGIDKKLILSHVNKSRRPRVKTFKEYAEAFTKALGRPINPSDLEK